MAGWSPWRGEPLGPLAPLLHPGGALLAVLALLALPAAQGQCEAPEQLPSARLKKVPEESEFPVGAKLEYVCRPGFLGRPFSITCLQDHTWSAPKPCKRRRCPNPGDVVNGKMLIDGDTTFGSTITYSCDDGFRLIGEPSLMCILVDNTVGWDNDPPLCERIPCGQPPQIANGYFVSSDHDYFFYGSVVTYYCNRPENWRMRPASLVGEKSIFCTSKDNRVGVWSGPAPQCLVPGTCTPPAVEPGVLVSGNRSLFHIGETVALQCPPGFVMAGPARVSCKARNRWGPELPTCSREEACAAFQEQLPNGRVRPPHTLGLGARVEFACNEGFRLEGPRASYCVLEGASAQWNSSAPACERISCPPPPDIPHGRHSGHAQADFPYGAAVTYACDPRPQGGRVWELQGPSTLRCRSDGAGRGVWSGPAPRCELAGPAGPAGFCQPPGDLPFAQPTAPWQELEFPVGTALSYQCRRGYSGPAFTITCLEGLAWSGAEGRCQRKSCGAPPAPHHGAVLVNTDTLFGSTVSYSCNEGYRLRGARSAACLLWGPNVAWNPEAPSCEQIVCAAPPAIGNGTHSGGHAGAFPYGAAVTYACDLHPQGGPAWELQGPSTLHCTSDGAGRGVWSGPAPRCELAGPTSPAGPSVCPQPPETPHGQLVDPHAPPHRPGMAVTFTCDPGYLLVGRALVFCTNQGTWSPLTHRCREVNCSLPQHLDGVWKELQGGRVYRYGDSVTLGCVDGYTLEGSPHSRCQADSTWAPPLALCTPSSQAALIAGVSLASVVLVVPAVLCCWVISRRRKGISHV